MVKVSKKTHKKDDLFDKLNSKLADLSEQDIKSLIDIEMKKSPDEINMDYIDFCYDILAAKKNNPPQIIIRENKHKKIRFSRALIAAAVLIIFAATTLSVSAYVFDFNIPSYIAHVIDGNAQVDPNLNNADTTADGYTLTDTEVAKQLADYGITPVTFPEKMIKENCSIISIENITTDESVQKEIYVLFEYSGHSGSLSISQLNEEHEWVGEETVMEVTSAEMIHINGMDILIFEQEGNCSIIYRDGLTKYNISIECDMDMALKFAKSIK